MNVCGGVNNECNKTSNLLKNDGTWQETLRASNDAYGRVAVGLILKVKLFQDLADTFVCKKKCLS